MNKDFSKNSVRLDSTLVDVLNALNKGIGGVVFLLDDQDRLKGIFTDGDIRRAILGGAHLDSAAEPYMNPDFQYARAGLPREQYLKKLTKEIRHLPLLDDSGRLVDFLSWADIWRLPVMEPFLGGNELTYVSDCITSNWISSQGSYVKNFESQFARFHDAEFSLTTSNGTTALHLAMVALGIGPGDEVIVPDLTFGASANTIIHTGATPVFVDVTEDYWNLDPEKIEAVLTPRVKAIMPVHLYGHPCDMDPVMEIARRHELYVVEDCAEALGAKYKGRLVGTFGDAGCFSFFSNKVITTGEGGMVITGDEELHHQMTILRDHGMTKEKRYWHEAAGYNYRLTNLQAAVGLAQIEQIDKFITARRKTAREYHDRLAGLAGITLPPEMSWAENIYWLYSILVDEKQAGISRDTLLAALLEQGIETRPFFFPLHIQPAYSQKDGKSFPVTDWLSRQGLSLPSSNGITIHEIERVCTTIKNLLKSYPPR